MKVRITTKINLDHDKNEIFRFQFREVTTDASGNMLDETEYNEDESVACKRIYRYFDDGTVKEYVEYNPLDELIERHVYLENEEGEIEEVVYEYGDGHKVVKRFRFSELGLADIATLYDEHGAILGYETYTFDEGGHVIERRECNEENIETVKYLCTYDDKGNPKEETKIVDGKLTEVTRYTYDVGGKVTRKEVSNNAGGYQVIDEYKYDDVGNMIHNTSFQNGTLVFENKCTYDQDQNLSTEEFFEIDFWQKRVTRHEKLLHVLKS